MGKTDREVGKLWAGLELLCEAVREGVQEATVLRGDRFQCGDLINSPPNLNLFEVQNCLANLDLIKHNQRSHASFIKCLLNASHHTGQLMHTHSSVFGKTSVREVIIRSIHG